MERIKKKKYIKQERQIFFIVISFLFFCSLAVGAEPDSIFPSEINSISSDNTAMSVAGNNALAPEQKFPSPLTSKPVELPEDEENVRLLEVLVGPYRINELIVVRHYQDILFVPLGAFSELIDLAIRTDPSTGTAKGFIFDEKKTFYLDINRGEVTLSGVLKRFDNKRTAARILDDLYIDSDLLSEWLSLKIEIDLYASQLKIKSDKPLPFQLRKERESRIKLIQERLIPQDRGYPRYTAPYEKWNYPHVNLSARTGVYKYKDGDTDSTFSHATYATADLFGMESAWYLAGYEDELLDDFRVTFGKKDIDGELLGPVRAREYAFGHVIEPRMELINRPTSIQPGLFFSNYPLTRQQQYDSHSFSGDLPPGWEVELYRNNSLLDYQPAGVEGRYQFDDVPLLYGHNHFRLVFYGPQGQIREETQTFELGQSLTLPGEQYYRVFVSKDEDSGNRTVMQYDIGINKNISATAGFVSLPIEDTLTIPGIEQFHRYFTAGIKGFQKSFFYKINHTRDSESGTAVDWGVQSRIGPVIFNLSEIYFNDFVSEAFVQSLAPISRRSSIKLDSAIPTTFISRIPISLEYQRDIFDDGNWTSRLVNRVSAQKHNYALSNTLVLGSAESDDDFLNGQLQVSRRAKRYNLRSTLGYELKPDREVTTIALTADGFRLWGFNASAGISKVLSIDSEELIFGLNRQMNGYTLGMDARATTDGVFSFNLTFNMGLVREPRSGRWEANSRPVANQGALSARVFLDTDADGQQGPDEEVLSGVKLNINGNALPKETDNNGVAFITGITPYREVDIDVALDTLDDPLWLSAKEGLRVDFRPGHVMKLDFPIIESGEIDGTTYVSFDGVEREASGVILELVDKNGKVLQSVKTAFDGFYVISQLPIGAYKLRVSEQQISELGLNPVEPRIIEITAEKQIINGQNFVLTKK